MTDQIDPKFLLFSEMLDQEDGLEPADLEEMSSDAALLLNLRDELRKEQPSSPLPGDFAATTAGLVQSRYQAQSGLIQRLIRWEPALRARPVSPTAATWLFATTLLGLGALATSWTALGLLGVLLLLPGVGLKRLLDQHLPRKLAAFQAPVELDLEPEATAKASPIFYLLPLLAITATAGFVGRLVTALGSVSLSFAASSTNMRLAGLAGALVVFVWLVNAFWPLLRAYEEATRGRAVRTLLVQSLYGAWFTLILGVLLQETSSKSLIIQADFGETLAAGGIIGVILCSLLLVRRRRPEVRKYPLGRAYRRFLAGMLVGLVPMMGGLALFYQASLTRQLTVEPQYDVMVEQVSAWVKAQKAIPDEQNGFALLRPVLFASSDEGAKSSAERLKNGSLVYKMNSSEEERARPEYRERAERARQEFLEELPKIRKAVAKPYFSYYQEGELDLQRRVPNYLTARAISQALQGLTVESLDRGDNAAALDFTTLNLQWADKFRHGVLIDQIISIALESLALESFERLLFEGGLSRHQLEQLASLLKQATPEKGDFAETMRRETYSVDREFQHLIDNGSDSEISSYSVPPTLARLIPRSYWKSERLAYLNLQLGRSGDWLDLPYVASESEEDLAAMLPWSLAAQEMVPNLYRAKSRALTSLGQFEVARLQVALQLYKLDHDGYPAALEALVPRYLASVPVDPVHPNLWKRKGGYSYKKDGGGYRLTSESPTYSSISLHTIQQYGPLGTWDQSEKAK